MLGFRKKQGEAGTPPEQPARAERTDVTADFPRGLPDHDRDKPVASARWHSAEEIAQLKLLSVWRPGMLLLGRDEAGQYYGHADDRHLLTVAGSRAGKGVSLIVPNLLFWPGSVIAIDPKGELASLTASRRSAAGSDWSLPMDGEGQVYALDPFNRVTGDARRFRDAAFNPMDGLDPATDEGNDRAYQIADALIIQSDGDGAFWTQGARSFLRSLILHVADREPPDSANLMRVRALTMLSGEQRKTLLEEMAESPNDIVARMGEAMKGRGLIEQGSIMSSCETQTQFLEGEEMRRVLTSSDFKLEDMKKQRITLYLCLPATRLATHGRWLRLMVSLAVEAMERTGPLEQGKPPVLFVLDEFAALGRMEVVEKAAGQIASFGVKLWPIVQDLTQLKRDYKDAWETFMGNAGCLTFFGNTDVTTTNHIQERLGQTEVVRTVWNANETWSQSGQQGIVSALGPLFSDFAPAGSEGQQKGGTIARNQQVTVAPLMHGFEIVRAFARETGKLLVLIPDRPPLALYRCVYHGPEDAALFGGLYDAVPGQDAPHTKRAAREDDG